jgi:hypothetical protein
MSFLTRIAIFPVTALGGRDLKVVADCVHCNSERLGRSPDGNVCCVEEVHETLDGSSMSKTSTFKREAGFHLYGSLNRVFVIRNSVQ